MSLKKFKVEDKVFECELSILVSSPWTKDCKDSFFHSFFSPKFNTNNNLIEGDIFILKERNARAFELVLLFLNTGRMSCEWEIDRGLLYDEALFYGYKEIIEYLTLTLTYKEVYVILKRNVELSGFNLSYIKMNGTQFMNGYSNATFKNFFIRDSSFECCIFDDVNFMDCDFSHSNFSFSKFKKCTFTRCIFQGCESTGCSVDKCKFDDCQILNWFVGIQKINDCTLKKCNISELKNVKVSLSIFEKCEKIRVDNVTFYVLYYRKGNP